MTAKVCSTKCRGLSFAGSGNPFFGRKHKAASIAQAMSTKIENGTILYGPDNPAWKGGYTMHADGYVMLDVGGEQFLEHRIVMAGILGRPLTDDEIVHHKNEIKHDNRPENLVLSTRSEHAKIHEQGRIKGLAAWAARLAA